MGINKNDAKAMIIDICIDNQISPDELIQLGNIVAARQAVADNNTDRDYFNDDYPSYRH